MRNVLPFIVDEAGASRLGFTKSPLAAVGLDIDVSYARIMPRIGRISLVLAPHHVVVNHDIACRAARGLTSAKVTAPSRFSP
jgi:hypothetical protein